MRASVAYPEHKDPRTRTKGLFQDCVPGCRRAGELGGEVRGRTAVAKRGARSCSAQRGLGQANSTVLASLRDGLSGMSEAQERKLVQMY